MRLGRIPDRRAQASTRSRDCSIAGSRDVWVPPQLLTRAELYARLYEDLSAAPPFLDFGAIREDCAPHPRRTFVSNVCTVPVTVNGVDLGGGTGPEFMLGPVPTLPLTLAPYEGFELSGPEAERVREQLVRAGHLPEEGPDGG